MSRFFSLSQLKHQLITPLQDAWQAGQITRKHPHMEPIIEAYRKFYPYPGASTSVSVDERHAKGIEDDEFTYGETRWNTFIELLPEMKLKPGSRFIDLGCGAGFLCFLVSQAFKTEATGVDLIEGFVANAQHIVHELNLPRIRFIHANFFDMSFLPFDCFYATCTCFPDETLEILSEKLREAPSGARILTVTSPVEGPHINQIKQIRARYDWGQDWVFIAERK